MIALFSVIQNSLACSKTLTARSEFVISEEHDHVIDLIMYQRRGLGIQDPPRLSLLLYA